MREKEKDLKRKKDKQFKSQFAIGTVFFCVILLHFSVSLFLSNFAFPHSFAFTSVFLFSSAFFLFLQLASSSELCFRRLILLLSLSVYLLQHCNLFHVCLCSMRFFPLFITFSIIWLYAFYLLFLLIYLYYLFI